MVAESNIVLITENDLIEETLKPKLVLLREIDNIIAVGYDDAIQKVKEISPELVLIYCEDSKEKSLSIVREIKNYEPTRNTSILLLINEYDADFVLSAYDENVTDYMAVSSDDAEVLIRSIWALKKNATINKLSKQQNLMEELNIIDKETGFYSYEYCEKVFNFEFNNIKKEEQEEAMLMLISAAEDSKTQLSPAILANSIKNSTRNSDVIVCAPANKFYLLLPQTPLKGAYTVWDKIKQKVGSEFTLVAALCEVGEKSYTEIEPLLVNALAEAVTTKQDLVLVNDAEKELSDSWLDKMQSSQKNFKLFKQAFNKKLEKVITPVFFQTQKLYEEKLFETEIEQYSNSTLSAFILKSKFGLSELKITYPGFAKINIDIIHEGLDSPENRRISLDLTELDEVRLTSILEEFIQEFKSSIN